MFSANRPSPLLGSVLLASTAAGSPWMRKSANCTRQSRALGSLSRPGGLTIRAGRPSRLTFTRQVAAPAPSTRVFSRERTSGVLNSKMPGGNRTRPPPSGTASKAAWRSGYCDAAITAAGGFSGRSLSALGCGPGSAAVVQPPDHTTQATAKTRSDEVVSVIRDLITGSFWVQGRLLVAARRRLDREREINLVGPRLDFRGQLRLQIVLGGKLLGDQHFLALGVDGHVPRADPHEV